MKLNTEIYETTANFESGGGSFEQLGNSGSYNLTTIGVHSRYVFNRRWAALGNFYYAQSESSSTSLESTNSGLTEIDAGVQWRFQSRPIRIVPELLVTYPLVRVEDGADSSLLNEGALVFKIGSWFHKRLFGLDNYAYFGFAYRDEGLAGLVPYRLGSFWDSDSLQLGGELFGYESVTDDEFTGTPSDRESIPVAVNAGSLKFYAVNPGLMSARGWIGYKFANFLVTAGYGFDVNGKNSAKGTTITIGLQWTSNLKQVKRRRVKKKRKSRRKTDLEKFKINEEGYDETLFDEEKAKKEENRRRQEKKTEEDLLKETEDALQ